jgi:Flp pilus assembly protein TadG
MTSPTATACRDRSSGRAGQGGSASLELVVVFPALIAAILLVVQAGIYWHARTLALAAAQQGLHAASALNGTTSHGQTQASGFLQRAGADGWLTEQAVTAERSRETATLTVTARAISLIPGLPGLPISQQATGPVEHPTGLGAP